MTTTRERLRQDLPQLEAKFGSDSRFVKMLKRQLAEPPGTAQEFWLVGGRKHSSASPLPSDTEPVGDSDAEINDDRET